MTEAGHEAQSAAAETGGGREAEAGPGTGEANRSRPVWQFVHGKAVMVGLRWRNRRLAGSMMALAVHLEDDIFPLMRARDEGWLVLELSRGDTGIRVRGSIPGGPTDFPGQEAVGETLLAIGVRQLRLDTQLECGQIVEAFLLLLHAAPCLESVTPFHGETASWAANRVAAAMLGRKGYHRFCSTMTLDRQSGTYQVKYTYCELFFQRVIKSTVERDPIYGDHRFLFAAAPRITAVGILAVAISALVALKSMTAAVVLLAVIGTAAAVALGQLVYAIGSQHYTREHLDSLVDNYKALTRKQLEEIDSAYRQLKALEKLRDDLVHMVVHDMKNPLLGIITELDYLKELTQETLDDEGGECLAEATSAARRTFEMVRSVLDVSRLEAGQMPLDRADCDLAEIARETAASLCSMARGHEIIVRAPGGVPCSCDAGVVGRVIANLVSNALKYSPKGEPVIVEADSDGVHCEVRVSDRGPGIPEHLQDRIFEKFGRVEDKDRAGMNSTGLGLTFCKLAVEAHGGTIGVASVPGEGSTFRFRLPAGEPPGGPDGRAV